MVLQNPFPATLVFSQLSALPPGVTRRSRRSLHSLLFATPANRLAPISQLPPLQWLADSLSLLPLFCAGAPFIFNRLQTLFAKHGGWGDLIPETLRDSMRFADFVTFLRHAPAR